MAVASFTTDVNGDYVVLLEVFDGEDFDQAEATITATTPNVPPTADAGPNQEALLGETITLDGSNSNDPDNLPMPLDYAWSFASLPTGSGLNDADI